MRKIKKEMFERRLLISVVFLCVVYADNTVYPTTVHQQGDTQTVYHGSLKTDRDDNIPSHSLQVSRKQIFFLH